MKTRYVVTHAATEDSHFGEEHHLATLVSAEFPEAEREPDGVWIIHSELQPNEILEKLGVGVAADAIMITAIEEIQVQLQAE